MAEPQSRKASWRGGAAGPSMSQSREHWWDSSTSKLRKLQATENEDRQGGRAGKEPAALSSHQGWPALWASQWDPCRQPRWLQEAPAQLWTAPLQLCEGLSSSLSVLHQHTQSPSKAKVEGASEAPLGAMPSPDMLPRRVQIPPMLALQG